MYETTEARDAERRYQPFVLHSHANNPRILHYPRLWKRYDHLILYYKTKRSANTVLDLSFALEARVTRPMNHLRPRYRCRWWMNRGRRFDHLGAGVVLNHIKTPMQCFTSIPCPLRRGGLLVRHLIRTSSAAEREETSSPNFTFVGQGHLWPGQSLPSTSVAAPLTPTRT